MSFKELPPAVNLFPSIFHDDQGSIGIMASKGPRSKLDHETRAKRQKALDAPREPRRPKTHWDHVLEEMVWLSKDFESERKWKLAQAKRVALRASKGMLDQATRGEKRVKEEEQRLRKVALNISKDVKKFWMKIEKLVLYKHQMALDEKKKKALDKQLEFLLGQTERYSTMLAENLVDSGKPVRPFSGEERLSIEYKDSGQSTNDNQEELTVYKHSNKVPVHNSDMFCSEYQSDNADSDEDYNALTEDEVEDDEHTIEEDEARITEEERLEELAALHNETDVPLEELLKRYNTMENVGGQSSPKKSEDEAEPVVIEEKHGDGKGNKNFSLKIVSSSTVAISSFSCIVNKGGLTIKEDQCTESERVQTRNWPEFSGKPENEHVLYDFSDEQEDGDFVFVTGEEKDDETTLSEEEELAKAESNEPKDELVLLQKESEIPLEELLARYKKDLDTDEVVEDESEYASAYSEEDEHENSNLEPVADSPIDGHGKESTTKNSIDERESENIIADAAAAARSAQPTGNTFSTTKVRTKFPFLLKHPLREYQHIGLDWLVTMYEKRLNGILADEMGLGKTIMTIALLAHLACEKGIWGPHLIVVPTSVMLNWETEFLRWCPAFKILTYYGSAKERKLKRQGWMKLNYFHVCITTYRLVIQDSKVFKRKKWKYLILDEAHLIKNWKSQRWQTLLNFNSKRRILLTGTPLQNDLMELWSLMHFLMPHIFQSHQEFKDWFSNPISGMVEGQEKVNKEVVDRLHNVLRPFILRRLKRDVEKQLPSKYEHVIYCRLSKRQRNLYEDFIASSETQATLASANFFGMISVIMQLRKVCNHPDLFEGRPIISSFDLTGIDTRVSSSICSAISPEPISKVNLEGLGLVFTNLDFSMNSWESDAVKGIETPSSLIQEREIRPGLKKLNGTNIFTEIQKAILEERLKEAKERAESIAWWNSLRCRKKPIYSTTLREILTLRNHPVYDIHRQKDEKKSYLNSSMLNETILSPIERFHKMIDQVECFMFAIPAARAPSPICWCSKTVNSVFLPSTYKEECAELLSPLLSPIRPAMVRRQVYFPDRRLIQFDCGKLQELAILLRRLKSEGHRALIFTQMTKMLDILEAFINLYGYTYMRLDGSTQPEERQTLMQRFNTNPKYFLFILSTRSGGVGINLVGADTVIFYDSDWNPAMDQQAQDRCHRIGQTREVHIYRLISESTIEENILKKANQKRALDNLVIQSGGYNTEFFKKLDPLELFSGHNTLPVKNLQKEKHDANEIDASVSNADVEAALKYVEDEADYMALKKVEEEEAVDNQEFTEDAIGRLEDDELVNEDDMKVDEPVIKNNGEYDMNEERAIAFASKDDEVDMLADVRQMAAAAAAAGQEISSFENQLRPIDRYAIRFLELWDPIIDKKAVESPVMFEETEWELDRIEKFKDDLEAEIDEDEEPLVYERWDAEFATEAYRQEVRALAQHQLMEELERKAKEKEAAERDLVKDEITNFKPKSKKKSKKAKFKSLKKGSLASETDAVKEELSVEPMWIDDVSDTSDVESLAHMNVQNKRKKAEKEEETPKKKQKIKKTSSEISPALDSSFSTNQHNEFTELKSSEDMIVDLEKKPASKGKVGRKISITFMPVKRIWTIKPEKLKKGPFWSRDYFPSPDSWLTQEDAILCAVVQEYGPHWSLVSDTLYGMTAGGFYRGRFRHPVHCCERFRELVQRYVLSSENLNNEKGGNMGSGKALLKVTEENIRMLLDVAAEMPDCELLLQKHFTALLSSVWKTKSRLDHCQSRNGLYSSGTFFKSIKSHVFQNSMWDSRENMSLNHLNYSGRARKLLAAALTDAYSAKQENAVATLHKLQEDPPAITEKMDLTLEFQRDKDECINPLPPVINLSIQGLDTPLPSGGEVHLLKSSQNLAENRFRAASSACLEGSQAWATSVFPTNDMRSKSGSKSVSLGKNKVSMSDSTRSSKIKSKKLRVDLEEMNPMIIEPQIQSMLRETPNDPNVMFDQTDLPVANFEMNDFNCSIEEEAHELIPYNFNPKFISGLEDCSLLPEYIDIG